MPEPTLLTGEPGTNNGTGDEAAAFAAFQETVPEAYREDPSMAVIKSMDGLVKSYIEGQKIIGVPTDRLVTIPNADTAEEKDWNAYYDKLGRPENGAAYKLAAPADMPVGISIPEDVMSKVGDLFHKYGLTPTQAQGIFNDYNGIALSGLAETTKADEMAALNGISDLKKEWGASWDAKIDTASRAMSTFGDDDFRKFLDETKLGDNPMMLKVFSSIGEKLMEANTETGGGGGSGGFRTLSPAEAKAEINILQADENFQKAYVNARHAGHKDAVDKMTRLFGFAHPEE